MTGVGGLLSLVAARGLLAALIALIPFRLPAAAPIRLDAPVFAFTLAVALAAGVAFSLVPLLSGSRLDLQESLKAIVCVERMAGDSVLHRSRTGRPGVDRSSDAGL